MMQKARILSLLLSFIMVFSICAAPFSSVFAEEQTTESQTSTEQSADSSGAVTAGYDTTEDFLETFTTAIMQKDYKVILNGKLVTTFINLIFGDGKEEGGVTTQELLDKLNAMDEKLDTYHKESMKLIKDMKLENEMRNYDVNMVELASQRSRIHAEIKGKEGKGESELIKKMEEGSEAEKTEAKNDLIKYYLNP